MNVLIFVVTMLMVMGIMTYARFESFRNSAAIQSLFVTYMQDSERKWMESQVEKNYENTPATNKEKDKKKSEKQIPASSFVSFYLFVHEEARDRATTEVLQLFTIAKNLILYLYQSQPFYQELAEKRPEFVDEILIQLERSTAEMLLTKKQKIRYKKDLATVDLQDSELNAAFYKMLKGSTEVSYGVNDPFRPEEGYPSLLNFITMENKTKVRVYLASPELLMAIYGDPTTVEAILLERERLYQEIKRDVEPMDKKVASEIFKGAFEGKQVEGISNSVLDFTVSKSRPLRSGSHR